MSPVPPGISGLPGLPVDPWTAIAKGMAVHAVTPRPDVGLTPHRVIHTQDKLVVRYYAPSANTSAASPPSEPPSALRAPPPERGGGLAAGGWGHPIVLVPSLINRAYILDLEPGRSLCAALAEAGHHVYLVDWGVPGPEDADEGVSYVVDELLPRAIDRANRHAVQHGALPGAIVLGYCMGGVVSAISIARHPESPVAGFIALNTPISYAHAGRFRDLVAPEHLDLDRDLPKLLDGDGLVPVNVMKPAFNLLDPVGSVTKYRSIDAASSDRDKLARVLARERWLEENVPMPGRFAVEFIKATYQQDLLLAGTWVLEGTAVNLRAITAPTLIVTCDGDFICPPAAALPLAQAVGSAKVDTRTLACGHIGVVVGAEGPRTFYPLVDRWAREVAGGQP